MKLLRLNPLTISRWIAIPLLLMAAGWAMADESKFSGNFLNLQYTPDQQSSQRVLEFWAYHDTLAEDTNSDTLKLRYYQPLQFDQWRATMRLDTSYVSNYGPTLPQHSTGAYSAGNTLLTVWGNHPNIMKYWGGTLGARVVFPFGNNGQWAVGPQIGTVYIPAEGSKSRISDFSPLARYMYGFDTKNNSFDINPNQPALVRNLNLFPTLGINLAPNTQIRFWDENGIILNTGGGGGWFVPLDAMVTHRLNKHFLFAVGASKQVVQSYQVYDWSVYGKVSFNF
ncbi:hypothetical protein [Polynucleobacter sp. es-EL-1]|jgi:hypothetical protein|uniref:hypothetical protein n=1 Tax=Polynucleobacter sp. es-EL-1 TaxID=1855652 RepID=UPI00203E0AF9|nr:hypothetical protein [Polynucleobacter sp. es-EL-1]